MKISKEDYLKISKEEMAAVKNTLPYGGIKMIAARTGLSYRMVQHVLNGKYRNQAVLKAAIEIIKEDNERKKVFLRKLLKTLSL